MTLTSLALVASPGAMAFRPMLRTTVVRNQISTRASSMSLKIAAPER
jgi:hypothetical protein